MTSAPLSFPRRPLRTATPLLLLLAAGAASVDAQVVGPRPAAEWCESRSRDDDRERVCEVRETRIPAPARLSVNGGPNGGITVRGWDGQDILVRSRVEAAAPSEADARRIASEVEVRADGGRIRTEGPRTGRREHWSVSFEVWVPRRLDLDLRTTNGGVHVADVSGTIEFAATNGGVTLSALSGDVRGSTTNGGLRVELTGDRWEGRGMDVRSTNGGVTVSVPEGYSAQLEAGTTNGGVQVDFPVTVQGRLGRRLTATLGDGGAPIRVGTTNGGVRVTRN
jgi:hypothetical protein